MSHFDAESSTGAFQVGEAVTWAAKATGINTTNAKAKNRLKYFETQAYIRSPSVIKLNDQMKSCLRARIPARTDWAYHSKDRLGHWKRAFMFQKEHWSI